MQDGNTREGREGQAPKITIVPTDKWYDAIKFLTSGGRAAGPALSNSDKHKLRTAFRGPFYHGVPNHHGEAVRLLACGFGWRTVPMTEASRSERRQ